MSDGSSCIFCRIVARQIPATIVAETEQLLAFKDIHPQAEVHNLIIPKKHVADIQSFEPDDFELLGAMTAMAQQFSKAAGQDFRLVINSGRGAGQIVFHLHMHYLAGKIQN